MCCACQQRFHSACMCVGGFPTRHVYNPVLPCAPMKPGGPTRSPRPQHDIPHVTKEEAVCESTRRGRSKHLIAEKKTKQKRACNYPLRGGFTYSNGFNAKTVLHWFRGFTKMMPVQKTPAPSRPGELAPTLRLSCSCLVVAVATVDVRISKWSF